MVRCQDFRVFGVDVDERKCTAVEQIFILDQSRVQLLVNQSLAVENVNKGTFRRFDQPLPRAAEVWG